MYTQTPSNQVLPATLRVFQPPASIYKTKRRHRDTCYRTVNQYRLFGISNITIASNPPRDKTYYGLGACIESRGCARFSGELYGEFNLMTSEWTDGLVPKMVRQCVQAGTEGSDNRKWIIFDGPVDAVWIENMNTVSTVRLIR